MYYGPIADGACDSGERPRGASDRNRRITTIKASTAKGELMSLLRKTLMMTSGFGVGTLLAVHAGAVTVPPSGTTEATYYADQLSMSSIVRETISPCATVPNRDSNLNPTTGSRTYSCTIYRPPLTGTTHYPIVTWANGTGALATQYAYFLKHIATWGFIVISVDDTATGVGESTWMAAQYLLDANNDASSPYYQKIDPDNVAAVGHSQGAIGAIGALEWSWIPAGGDVRADGKKIKTTISIELPAQNAGCSSACTPVNMPAGTSLFYIDGANDPISPATSWTDSNPSLGLNSIAAYYNATPTGVTKAKATAKDPVSGLSPAHNDIQGQPGCTSAITAGTCKNGVYRYLGYTTAWLMWQLKGDGTAHAAFVKPTGDLFTNTTLWSNTNSNVQ